MNLPKRVSIFNMGGEVTTLGAGTHDACMSRFRDIKIVIDASAMEFNSQCLRFRIVADRMEI